MMFCIAFEGPPTSVVPVSMAAYAEDRRDGDVFALNRHM